MENDVNQQYLNIEKNTLKNFFKKYIEDTKHSTDNKTQIILTLLNSIKEETEQKISKINFYFLILYFLI